MEKKTFPKFRKHPLKERGRHTVQNDWNLQSGLVDGNNTHTNIYITPSCNPFVNKEYYMNCN